MRLADLSRDSHATDLASLLSTSPDDMYVSTAPVSPLYSSCGVLHTEQSWARLGDGPSQLVVRNVM